MTLVSTPLMKVAICLATVASLSNVALAYNHADSAAVMLPDRAIVLTGDPSAIRKTVVDALYNNKEFEFHDPSAPRFLLLDRKGKVAFGIGGYVYATMSYGFNGAIADPQFITYEIPVPFNPSQRSGMQFDASHSTLFLQLAGHSEKFGTYMAYVQSEFSGGTDHYLTLKQAYVKVENVTLGLAQSTFVDPAGPPELDTQGPGAQLYKKNILIRYSHSLGAHWQAAISIEDPSGSTYMVNDGEQKAITQRVPDIPAYVQFGWGEDSHLRLSGIVRTLSYRDLLSKSNCFATGWGVQLSGQAQIPGNFTAYYEAYYGAGLGSYIHDLSGYGFNLIPSPQKPGKMFAPGNMGCVVGVRWDFCQRGLASMTYTYSRLYDQGHLGGDTFRRSMAVEANVMYTLFPDFQIGMEYLHGRRYNMNGEHGWANRIMAAVKYSF